jgi:hypothetical protein
VSYASPYSYLQPLGPGSTVTLDSVTGLLSILPTQIGVFEIGIEVREFRNGILFSSTVNDFEITVGEFNVGISDPLQSSFEVYPNPAIENVFVHLSENKPSKILIYDELGRVIYSTELNQDIQLSTSNWTKGFYHVMLKQEDQSFFSSLVLQ